MYDQRNDPYEQVNLPGRREFRKQADELQAKLKKLLVARASRSRRFDRRDSTA